MKNTRKAKDVSMTKRCVHRRIIQKMRATRSLCPAILSCTYDRIIYVCLTKTCIAITGYKKYREDIPFNQSKVKERRNKMRWLFSFL